MVGSRISKLYTSHN